MTSKLIVLACLLAVSQSRHLSFSDNFLSSRIIGGTYSEPGEFPHHVSLQVGIPFVKPYKHICGGAIIKEDWIITAAHCIEIIKEYAGISNLIVKAGKHDLYKIEDSQQTSVVEKHFVHEKWAGIDKAGPYDIALLKLETPLRFNKYVGSIKLPEQNTEPSGDMILSGWGAIEPQNQDISNILFTSGKIPTLDRKICNSEIKRAYKALNVTLTKDPVDETNICTRHNDIWVSACNGDNGSPLISENTRELVGIVSWSVKLCGIDIAPSVFMRVSYFTKWIKNVMSEN